METVLSALQSWGEDAMRQLLKPEAPRRPVNAHSLPKRKPFWYCTLNPSEHSKGSDITRKSLT